MFEETTRTHDGAKELAKKLRKELKLVGEAAFMDGYEANGLAVFVNTTVNEYGNRFYLVVDTTCSCYEMFEGHSIDNIGEPMDKYDIIKAIFKEAGELLEWNEVNIPEGLDQLKILFKQLARY